MKRGTKPTPTALRRANGNPGKRGYNADEPIPPAGMPECPDHLNEAARNEWHRLAPVLHDMGVLAVTDRAALAAYCQAYGRWVEAEERLTQTPLLIRTPSGYVQQSPWLSLANKQMELMGRFMAELGLTPASRSRVVALRDAGPEPDQVNKVEFVIVWKDANGDLQERPFDRLARPETTDGTTGTAGQRPQILLDGDL